MKNLFILSVVAILFLSCANKVARITEIDPVKTVELHWNDPGIRDTTFTVSATVKDSIILKRLRAIEDSLIYEKFKSDSLYAVFQRDSVYKEFQQDSINFRKITKIINGGYNGWNDRYRLWLNAREVIKQHNDTIRK